MKSNFDLKKVSKKRSSESEKDPVFKCKIDFLDLKKDVRQNVFWIKICFSRVKSIFYLEKGLQRELSRSEKNRILEGRMNFRLGKRFLTVVCLD